MIARRLTVPVSIVRKDDAPKCEVPKPARRELQTGKRQLVGRRERIANYRADTSWEYEDEQRVIARLTTRACGPYVSGRYL